MASVGMAWRVGRAQRAKRPRREPVVLRAASWAGRKLPTLKRARTAIMQTAGFASIVFALFEWSTIAGFVGAGVSLLILEALSGSER